MEEDCIFCKIAKGEIPSEMLHQDDDVIAIRDISPQAPTHLLVMPRAHIPAVSDLTAEQASLAGHMIEVATSLARQEGVDSKGYRLVVNCGKEGGQLVPHLHLHVLGGRQLSDQMG
jgi:histidine triad (HIT) family protein